MNPPGEKLARLAEQALEAVERLRAPSVPSGDRVRGDLREDILLALRTKVLPELRARGGWPVFVGVQGGTNVGKSTVFNALAGQILSPAIVQASATKHPLVFLEESWRDMFLRPGVLPGFECRELEDPRELIVEPERTERLYLRFHSDARLRPLALIDSPDFDSILDSNQTVARRVTVISDLTVFVTTAQKYRDRELVMHLELLQRLKASVILVFNRVDEEIVFQTLLEDLLAALAPGDREFTALRLPRSSAAHPEEEIREILRGELLEKLLAHEPRGVKLLLIRRTLERCIGQIYEWCRRLRSEVEVKSRIASEVEAETRKSIAAYSHLFRLALPEETLAVRRLLRETELSSLLAISGDVAEGKGALRFVGVALRRGSDVLRRLLLRLSYRSEGAIEETGAAVREYAAARNESDLEQIRAQAEALRRNLEALLRSFEEKSPLARHVLQRIVSPEDARDFPERIRAEFERINASVREAGGERILEKVESWIERRAILRRALFASSALLKVGAGVLLAWILPPDGILHILNWAYFAGGFLLAAYAVALTIAWSLRRRHLLRKARIEGARTVLHESTVRPLLDALEESLPESDLREVETRAAALEKQAAAASW
ncbi:MAG: 50S ribosome-binding GTPase [Planctomycetes bacterium]|nr:50S ribosome-binding GTPase [Planctomycetota bacterium]